MKVLALSSYPTDAAATRFRVEQYVDPLNDLGIQVDLRSFISSAQFGTLYRKGATASKLAGVLSSTFERLAQLKSSSGYDLLFVQREAMPFGPAIFERLFQGFGRMPMVLDLDDATYVRYVSPTYGRLGSALKFFGKTDRLIDRSALVICGNRFIADYVSSRGKQALVLPTIVDTDVFRPISKENDVPVIGWIGTHSTFPFLETLFPTLQKLSKNLEYKLRIIGSGKEGISVEGVKIESVDWSLEREVDDFQSLDIGLYPIDTTGSLDPAWLAGKSGFKAVQYLAVGVPFVMSPVGVCADIGVHGETHFNAETVDDWYNSLSRLLVDSELRRKMGEAGRANSLKSFGFSDQTNKLAKVLLEAAGK